MVASAGQNQARRAIAVRVLPDGLGRRGFASGNPACGGGDPGRPRRISGRARPAQETRSRRDIFTPTVQRSRTRACMASHVKNVSPEQYKQSYGKCNGDISFKISYSILASMRRAHAIRSLAATPARKWWWFPPASSPWARRPTRRDGATGKTEAPRRHRQALRGGRAGDDDRRIGCLTRGRRLRRPSSVRSVPGPRPLAGDQCELGGRQGLSALAESKDEQALPPVVGGGVGVCGAGGDRRAVSLRVCDLHRPGERQWSPLGQTVQTDGVSAQDGSGGFVSAQRLRLARHARQCVGVGGGLLASRLSRRARGRQRADCRRPLFVARASRWLLVFR